MGLFQKKDHPAEELRKLQEARLRLEAEDAADQQAMPVLREKLAASNLSAVLGDKASSRPKTFPNPEELASSAEYIRGEISACEARILERQTVRPKLLERIREAIRAHGAARAEQIRKQATTIRGQYDRHVDRRNELLAQLEQHDAVPYAMDLNPRLAPGTVVTPMELAIMRKEPRTAAMEREGNRLLAEADRIEADAERACKGGRVTGMSLDELLAAVADNPLAPTRQAVESWFAGATARANGAWDRQWSRTEERLIPKRELNFELSWNADGEIVLEQSAGAYRVINVLEFQAAHGTPREAA